MPRFGRGPELADSMNDWHEAEDHVERAHEHYEAGDWARAESELREALALNPYKADWHFNLGLTLEAAGRLDEAVRAFSDAVGLDPEHYQTVFLLGVTQLRLDEVKPAIEWLSKARQLEPERAEPWIHLIEAYARQGDHDQAEEMFYRSLQMEGDHALAYANVAESLLDREQFERAAYCLREAASIDPQLPRVHARLATACARSGRHERARQLYLRELRESPGDIDTLLDLGCLLIDMNRLAEAGEKFRRVLEIESDNTEAHFQLGELAVRQHRQNEAIAAFRLVMRLDPDYPEARRRLARLILQQGEIGEARKLLRHDLRALRADASMFEGGDLEDLGLLLLDVRLPRDAADVFSILLDRRPQDAATLHHLSVAYFQMGDRARGMHACAQSLRIDPKRLAALHNITLACVQERQWRRARQYLDQALSVAPDDHALRRLRLTLRLQRCIETLAWVARRRKVGAQSRVRR